MSWSLSDTEGLRRELDAITAWKVMDNVVRVTTQCMYPSNGLVNVYIRGSAKSAVVTDEGGAVGEAFSAGAKEKVPDKYLTQLVASQNLYVSNGVVRTRMMPIEHVPMAIMLVANASKEVATWLYDHSKIKRTKDFKGALSRLLQSVFHERLTHESLVSGKRKLHKFSNVITLPNDAILIVDPVTNDASSINSRVVANLDVQQAENPNIQQRIVYDDEDDWTPDNLGLLGIVGAPIVPFSKSPQAIQRIANARADS